MHACMRKLGTSLPTKYVTVIPYTSCKIVCNTNIAICNTNIAICNTNIAILQTYLYTLLFEVLPVSS